MFKKKFFPIMFAVSLSFSHVHADDSCDWYIEIQNVEDNIPLSDHIINHINSVDNRSIGFKIMCETVGLYQDMSTQDLLHYHKDTTIEYMTALLSYMMGAKLTGSELEENRSRGLQYKAHAFTYALDYNFSIAEIITLGELK